jgi:hypothetical protein
MRRTKVATIGVLSLVLVMMMVQPGGAITFGRPDDGGHPSVGALVGEFNGQRYQVCTGTLIAPTVFLTASHCLVGLEAIPMWVTFEEVIDADADHIVDLGVTLLEAPLVNRHPHPLFESGGANNTYDVAVIVLPEQTITPSGLPPAGLLDQKSIKNESFTTVGYGTVRNTKRYGPNGFEVGTERMLATQTVNSVNKAWITFSMNPSTGNGGTCYGDSGGPHFLGTGAAETNIVVSLTVTGDTPCRSTDKTYRLDTPWALDFLAGFVALP